MPEEREPQAWKILKEECEKGGYGEWEVRLIVYRGRLTGYDELKPFFKKFREQKKNT